LWNDTSLPTCQKLGEKKTHPLKIITTYYYHKLKINTIIIIIKKYTYGHDDDDAAAQHCLCFWSSNLLLNFAPSHLLLPQKKGQQ
jgi:hypothetical protein